MISFKLTAVGNLARNPELSTSSDATFARFCLLGNDEIKEGEPDGPRHVTTSLWFFAFGNIASTIAQNAGKGDQLILEARVVARADDWNYAEVGGPLWNHRGEALHAVPAVPIRVRVRAFITAAAHPAPRRAFPSFFRVE